jgi:DNA-binding MarR family transcriptional regulator
MVTQSPHILSSIDHEIQLKQTLADLGLGESEITILLLSHRLGASSIGQLAEESRMGRITVHEIVRRLITK